MDAAQTALNKAKIALMGKPDSAFFSTLCFSLIHKFDEGIPTACTNGKWVRYSPKFFMEYCKNQEERIGLMMHEVLHVAYMHVLSTRRGTRDPRKWNIAGDHVINLQLLARGFQLPEGGLADKQYIDMGTEQIYDLLKDDETVELPMEDIEPISGDGAEGDKDLQREVEDILIRAAMQSKMAGDKPGTIPGDIELFLNKLLHPKLPAKRILQKYLMSRAKNDYSFRKPNRRLFPKHIMPGLYSESLMEIACAVDISGSVTDEQFFQITSDLASILKMMKPELISLIHFDTEIHGIDKLKNVADLMRVKFTGRGGTDVTEVIEWANTNKPQVLLIFTDGYFTMPDIRPKCDVVWLIHNNEEFTAPYGKVVHYEI